MKKLLPPGFLLLALNCFSQDQNFCTGAVCYQQTECYGTVSSADYTFGTVGNIWGQDPANTVDLQMTVFSPCNLPADINNPGNPGNRCAANCKRPFILLMHGGGFRKGCRNTMESECKAFARRGYIAATIDYRTGWYAGDAGGLCVSNTGGTTCDATQKQNQQFAVYKGIQDGHAAMRFIRHYADALNIDPDNLYIGGQSAGAVIAANITYVNQNEFNDGIPGARTALGRFDESGNTFADVFTIKALYNNWGAVLKSEYIRLSSNAIPMIAFHGIDDETVPFEEGPQLGCTPGAEYGTAAGSKAMYDQLTSSYPTLPVELYACVGDHGIFEGSPLGTTETNLKSLYRIQKAICFFRRVRQGATTQIFEDFGNDDLTIVDESQLSRSDLDSQSPLDCDINTFNKQNSIPGYVGSKFKLYANGENIILKYALNKDAKTTIYVNSITGITEASYSANNVKGDHQYTSAKPLRNGVYLVSVFINNRKEFAGKIIINQ
jgi:predicted esterase